jgi:hypothetical protein
MPKQGTKFDSGKLRYDLIPPHALEKLAEVYTLGSKKYGDYNWKEGMDWSRCIAAMMRHTERNRKGESLDEEGFHHLAAVAFYCFTLMEYERCDIGNDDRRVD